jgi:hypothetical protein
MPVAFFLGQCFRPADLLENRFGAGIAHRQGQQAESDQDEAAPHAGGFLSHRRFSSCQWTTVSPKKEPGPFLALKGRGPRYIQPFSL